MILITELTVRIPANNSHEEMLAIASR